VARFLRRDGGTEMQKKVRYLLLKMTLSRPTPLLYARFSLGQSKSPTSTSVLALPNHSTKVLQPLPDNRQPPSPPQKPAWLTAVSPILFLLVNLCPFSFLIFLYALRLLLFLLARFLSYYTPPSRAYSPSPFYFIPFSQFTFPCLYFSSLFFFSFLFCFYPSLLPFFFT
jgi:hypothetical protein